MDGQEHLTRQHKIVCNNVTAFRANQSLILITSLNSTNTLIEFHQEAGFAVVRVPLTVYSRTG
jgi:hypothetical protein